MSASPSTSTCSIGAVLLTAEQDMPDEVRAKLYLALGRAVLATGPDDAPPPAMQLEAGVAHLKRAIDLHSSCGGKKDLERAERLLKKHALRRPPKAAAANRAFPRNPAGSGPIRMALSPCGDAPTTGDPRAVMSGFIATGTAGTDAAIENDGFWPAIDPIALRQRIRLDGSVAAERLRAAIVNAVLAVNDELAAWKAQQQATGREHLSDVPRQQGRRTSRAWNSSTCARWAAPLRPKSPSGTARYDTTGARQPARGRSVRRASTNCAATCAGRSAISAARRRMTVELI